MYVILFLLSGFYDDRYVSCENRFKIFNNDRMILKRKIGI